MADFEDTEKALQEIEANSSPSEFIYNFLQLYGTAKSTLSKLRKNDDGLDGIDHVVCVKKKVFFMSVAEGTELLSLLDNLKNDPSTHRQHPRFIIVTDFKKICAYDTKLKTAPLYSDFNELHINYEFFLPLLGRERYTAHVENFADVKAAEKMAKIYDEIVKANPEFLGEEYRHALNVFLTRLLFCFFAEDTGIFDKSLFTETIANLTAPDGSDLSSFFDKLFRVLDDKERKNCSERLKAFPYVNGKLFADRCPIPKFNTKLRDLIIECGSELNWSGINPDIFGSMLQAVSFVEDRSVIGQHYTSVPNIMKVISPLFLDSLYEEFEKGKNDATKLTQLQKRIADIKIFDPACGSGNFLIIAYKQLRELELKIILRVRELRDERLVLNHSQVPLSNFYGIEIDDFACEIARLALYLSQHQMNQKVESALGVVQPTLPLRECGKIVCGNATRLDWDSVCPRSKLSTSLQDVCENAELESSPLGLIPPPILRHEIYVLGNPPYFGTSKQTKAQKEDVAFVFAKTIKSYKSLDYISCWFWKACNYLQGGNVEVAFVSTNSVTQGEQVTPLWKPIFEKSEISFAYSSFKWTNNAKHNAGVTCVIIGLSAQGKRRKKYLYGENRREEVGNINGYLIPWKNVFVQRCSNSLAKLPEIRKGSQPTDDGNLIFEQAEIDAFLTRRSDAKIFIKKYIGSVEYINGFCRFCLWIEDCAKDKAIEIPEISDRISKIASFRERSSKCSTRKLAETSWRFAEIRYKKSNSTIIVPRHSSETRKYIPMGFLGEDCVVADSALAIYDAPLWLFAVITSQMHMVWVRAVCGRLKTDYRYSAGLCYNTFPFPAISDRQKKELTFHAKQILKAREMFAEKTMADLYSPKKMPKELKEAHDALDVAVEQCYRKRPFESDEKRLEFLFKAYEKMTAGQHLSPNQMELL